MATKNNPKSHLLPLLSSSSISLLLSSPHPPLPHLSPHLSKVPKLDVQNDHTALAIDPQAKRKSGSVSSGLIVDTLLNLGNAYFSLTAGSDDFLEFKKISCKAVVHSRSSWGRYPV
mmetsp:Transcript_10093/g.11808  ORF Transcript_10093/g.11808 Transcript_10093/m.11808 type:complete len:116 (-) Transcript_10093:415-762(-)